MGAAGHAMAVALLGTSLLLLAYVHVGYPLLLAVWSRLAGRPVRRGPRQPSVAVVIAAHNERATILAKIDNCLALDYPPARLAIIVSVDGSTDGTEALARRRAGERVHVVASPYQEGKAATLNRAIGAARADVVVFCDARQSIAPDAISALVADLEDPAVGAVSGELVLLGDDGAPSAGGVGLYWRYEKLLRRMESRIHSTLGATGALYAIRRELLAPIPPETLLDDVVIPMRAVLAGRRTVFEPRAKVYDRMAPPAREFRRKVRTLAGNFQLLELMPELLSPTRNPVFFQFVSHKLGRLLVPYLLLAALLANAALRQGPYGALLAIQCALYAMAAAGALGRERPRAGGRRLPSWLYAPFTFVLMNAAAAVALYRYLELRGRSSAASRARLAALWAPADIATLSSRGRHAA